jgi:D-ornithine 4,5-aminomutase subunit alpha
MTGMQREDDFEARRAPLRKLSDQQLHEHFWKLVDEVVAPLIEEARSHTTPSIERSVLLRMGFSSLQCRELVEGMRERGLLGHGAGRLVLELSKVKGLSIRQAGEALLEGRHWEELPR